jgi:hypothetical protein
MPLSQIGIILTNQEGMLRSSKWPLASWVLPSMRLFSGAAGAHFEADTIRAGLNRHFKWDGAGVAPN